MKVINYQFTKSFFKYILVSSLLFLGLLNPLSSAVIDTYVGYFLLGLVAFFTFYPKKILLLLFSIVVAFIILLTQFLVLQAFVAYLAGVGLVELIKKYNTKDIIFLYIVISTTIISSLFVSGEIRTFLGSNLEFGTYNNDAGVFLKTYQLVEQEIYYYQALNDAQLGRFAGQYVNGDVWGWRLPTIFYIWKLLPGDNGINIYFLYVLISSLVLYISYRISLMYSDSKYALIPAYLLFPYLNYPSRNTTILQTEWWSVLIYIIGVYLVIRRKYFYATIVLSVTVLVREIYILPIFLMLNYTFIRMRRYVFVFIIPLIAVILLYIYHLWNLNNYIPVFDSLLKPRVVSNGIYFIQQTLSFASLGYFFVQFRPLMLFFILALLGFWHIYRNCNKHEAIIWSLALIPFPIAFLHYGTLPYNDYWGIIYIPLAIIFAPLSIGLFLQNDKKAQQKH